VNGKEYDSASKWHAKWGGDGIKIGLNRGGKNNWKGYIDEVKIYKRAFTVDNITSIYSKSLPPIAESFDVQDNGNNIHLDLSWYPVKGATSYNLYRDSVSGITIDDFYKNISINGTAPTATCNSTSCTFTDDNVTVGNTYYYRVTGVNNIGFGNLAPAIEKSECVGGC
jgi:fibronectin type 3 domain-containing protein